MENILVTIGNAKIHLHGMGQIQPTELFLDDVFHMHFYPEFHYVLDGCEYIKTKNKTYALEKGDICIIPTNTLHNAAANFVSRVCFNVIVDKNEGSEVNDYYTEISNFFKTTDEVLVLNDPTISALMGNYYNLYWESSTENLSECQRGLLLINVLMKIVEICNKANRKQQKNFKMPDTMTERKWIIEEFISSKYNEKGGIGELAKILHIGVRHTRDLVKKITGKEFKDLIIEQRMSIAKTLLDEGSHSKEEIARLVGYNSYSGFYISFKKFLESNPELKIENLKNRRKID